MSDFQLTETHRAILNYAIENTSGRVEWFPENIKGGARAKVTGSLVKHGMLTDESMVTAAAYEAMGLDFPGADAAAEPEAPSPVNAEPAPETLPEPPAEITTEFDPAPLEAALGSTGPEAPAADAAPDEAPATPQPAETRAPEAPVEHEPEGLNPEIQAALAILGFRDELMTWVRHASPEAIQAALPRLQAVLTGGKSKAPRAAAPRTPRPAGEVKEPRGDTKKARCVAMLKRPEGASNQEMQDALGWQEHSVRGFIAGEVRKKMGFTVNAVKEGERGLVYRIVDATPAPVEAPAEAPAAPSAPRPFLAAAAWMPAGLELPANDEAEEEVPAD